MPTQNRRKNTVFSSPLNRTFSWFHNIFEVALSEAVHEFWGCEVQSRLMAVFDTSENIFRGEEFFVTQILPNKTTNSKNAILIKLSKELCGLLLENILGKNSAGNFSFDYITELEAKILTEFNTAIGGKIKISQQNNKANKVYNLIFYIKTPDGKNGKLIICIPANLVLPQEIQTKEFKFNIKNFAKMQTNVSIFVGTSKTTLKDLKQLGKEDIVVLENSRLSKMMLYVNGESAEIKVNPDPSLIVNAEENEENIMSENLSQDMWDTIQVEIGAEFEKIKISLGELKQISEGLVVDIGSVYENKISLKVEKKLIATGELVIINDRYGIRIDEVFKQEEDENLSSTKSKNNPITDFEDETDSLDTQDEIDENDDFSDFDVDDDDL